MCCRRRWASSLSVERSCFMIAGDVGKRRKDKTDIPKRALEKYNSGGKAWNLRKRS